MTKLIGFCRRKRSVYTVTNTNYTYNSTYILCECESIVHVIGPTTPIHSVTVGNNAIIIIPPDI